MTPPLGGGGGSDCNIAMPFRAQILERCGYPMVQKNLKYVIRFDTMHEHDGHRMTAKAELA